MLLLEVGAIIAPASIAPAQVAPSGAIAVPYLAQSELLCGGAAVAMVERWWGRREVYAEEFRHLVRDVEGGIRTTDLATAARDRGWRVDAAPGAPARVQHLLGEQIPVIALIEVGRDRYHYVVIVAWDSAAVTFHDPAVAPFTRLPVAEFTERWRAADDWLLVMAPATIATEPGEAPPAAVLPCGLQDAADAARRGDLARAEELLDAAARACPDTPLVMRERAGLRFRQQRMAEAERLAGDYLALAPHDTLAVQLLAALRHLRGDRLGALVTWNTIGQPRLDLIRVSGLVHVRFRVVTRATGLQLASVLTTADLRLAARRVADIPALGATRVSYTPIGRGLAEVDIAAPEPLRWPTPPRLAIGAARAAFGGVAELEVGSIAGAGERWEARWRWRSANPEVAVRLEGPVRLGAPGILGVSGEWEEWRFDAGMPDLRRRAATLDFRSWWSAAVESRIATRHERWRDGREAVAIGLGIGLHDRGDRAALTVDAEEAIPISDHDGYRRVRAELGWRIGNARIGTALSTRVGILWADRSTPAGLLPVAGGDAGRAVPLRAHRWDRDDRLPSRRIGRTIVHGGVAIDRFLAMAGPFTLGAGVFVDVARVSNPLGAVTDGDGYVDAGAGVRVGLPGGGGRVLRIDVARGVAAEPGWGISIGVEREWPFRARGVDGSAR